METNKMVDFGEIGKQSSEDKMNAIHGTLFEMLIDFKSVCDENNLNYSLIGGSLIGAVRHKDFIPWDDDIDIAMYREDAYKLTELFLKKFGDKYEIVHPGIDVEQPTQISKIYLKKSTFIESDKMGSKKYNFFFIDVFHYVDCPKKSLSLKRRSFIYHRKAIGLIYIYKFPSKYYSKGGANKSLKAKLYYSWKRTLGFFLSWFNGYKRHSRKIVKLTTTREKSNNWLMITHSEYDFFNYPKEYYLDTIEVPFRNIQVRIIRQYDDMLTKYYGNYMEIPPIEKRKTHLPAYINTKEHVDVVFNKES